MQSRIDKMDTAGLPPVAQDIVDKELLASKIKANLLKLTSASRKVYYRKCVFVDAQLEEAVRVKRAKTAVTSSASDEAS